MLSRHFLLSRLALTAVCLVLSASAAAAQERLMFSAYENMRAELVAKIKAETVRLDVATWYLTERTVTDAIIARHKAGVTVRVIGDRVSIFENDPNTTREFEHLATNGVPIRVRYNPTWFPEIIHWKTAIFVGQERVAFGSANFTVYELAPWSSTNYHDETMLFSDDLSLVNGFKTKFDQYWADTTTFKDFNEAYRLERGQEFPVQLQIDRTRREQNHAMPPDVSWAQGSDFNNRLINAINAETSAVDICIFRLSASGITNALINKQQDPNVNVRVIVEPNEYNRDSFPEYELTRANIDRLWVAGVPIKRRVHTGLMHMKTLITSSIATNASSNFTNNWQRDHNYFIPRSTKPGLWQDMKTRFNEMWNDPSAFGSFSPAPARAAALNSPANGATGVSQTPTLVWKRATWAVAYDVYVGTSTSNMTFRGRVNAVLNENPPSTYSWTAPTALAGGTTHYWKIVSRTFATDVKPSLIATSATRSFTTGGSGGGGGGTTQSPYGGSARAIPGTIQAEDFDNGGQNLSWWDKDAGNKGSVYRTNVDVDIQATSDSGGGHNVGWIGAGEWLEYTVNVGTSGTYTLEARVAAPNAGGTFRVEFAGVDKTGTMTVPGTGSYQTWTTVSRTVSLSAGTQVMRVFFIAAGPSGGLGNLNWIRLSGTTASASTPYSGSAVRLPGRVQAENFDHGGSSVAYWDKDSGNKGGVYRTDVNVDIQATADAGGGHNVGWIAAGEWLQYTVDAPNAGDYTLQLRVASAQTGGTLHVQFGGDDKTGPLTIPATGSYQTWTTISAPVSLDAGVQAMRVSFDEAGASGGVGNLNWIDLE
jgi:hypothetical protein